MSFGNISLMLEKSVNILNNIIGNNAKIDMLELAKIKHQVYRDLQNEFADVTPEIMNEIFNRLFNKYYVYDSNLSFDNGKNCFRECEEKYPDIKVPSKYKKLNKHFNKLKDLPQPAQRSQEWYDYRYTRITASDMAAAIDLNPYEPVESFILKKCDPNFPFRANATVFHGVKFESTATGIYEHIYNSRVFEFGALPSDKYKILGASPDGICSKYTLDNKFSDRLGCMLEIKCPVTRDIVTSGKIQGEICPYYYYCQVQQQLVCCELDVCDFWQCKLTEYESKDKYLLDNCEMCINTIGTNGTKMDVDNRLKKGIILEFYPKIFTPEFEGDLAEWKSKHIYPKRLDMDSSQYESWVFETLNNFKETYPDINKDYYFYRIIYWKLESSHNVEIVRDDVFFNNILPILNETWERILYYRKNQDKLNELQLIVNKRKKYVKMALTYTIHNNYIVNNKYKILSGNFDNTLLLKLNKLVQKPIQKYTGYKTYVKTEKVKEKDCDSDCDDFIDNNECDFIDDCKDEKSTVKKSTVKNVKDEKSTVKKSTVKKSIKHTDTKNSSVKKLEIKSFKTINSSNDDDSDFID
jgi:putative phage-type endonuclease